MENVFSQRQHRSIRVESKMSLPQIDLDYLNESGVKHNVTSEANMTCVVITGYVPPEGYDRNQTDLLLRLNPGFPDVPPDMWWFDPPLRLKNGGVIEATQVNENHIGRTWQRWSRHLAAGQWKTGIDSLQSFVALIRKELERCAKK
jgi:hypothetical protein